MIRFELVTLDGTKFGEQVYEIVLPTPEGYIAILPHHIPLVSLITPGIITVRRRPEDPDARLEYFAVSGGAIEVLDNVVRVLVDEADREDEINEQEAQKAYQRAQDLLKQAQDQVSLDHAQSLVDRQSVRLQVAGLKRRHHR